MGLMSGEGRVKELMRVKRSEREKENNRESTY
jgi:hypothetical protein